MTRACAAAPTWRRRSRWAQPLSASVDEKAYALAAGGVNGVVSQLRSLLAELDLSGVVAATGSAVRGLRLGEKVMADLNGDGGCALPKEGGHQNGYASARDFLE